MLVTWDIFWNDVTWDILTLRCMLWFSNIFCNSVHGLKTWYVYWAEMAMFWVTWAKLITKWACNWAATSASIVAATSSVHGGSQVSIYPASGDMDTQSVMNTIRVAAVCDNICDMYFCHRYWAWVGLNGLWVVLWQFKNVIDHANMWRLRKRRRSI